MTVSQSPSVADLVLAKLYVKPFKPRKTGGHVWKKVVSSFVQFYLSHEDSYLVLETRVEVIILWFDVWEGTKRSKSYDIYIKVSEMSCKYLCLTYGFSERVHYVK